MGIMKMPKKKEVWVPGHRWSHSSKGTHPGYWRAKRPIGRQRIKTKQFIVKRIPIRDQYGQFN